MYKLICRYESEIFTRLNFLAKGQNQDQLFGGYFWSPKQLKTIRDRLDFIEMSEVSLQIELAGSDRGKVPPPTSFPQNEFFRPFQEIVDTYGVPDYKEANPAVFAMVSFPFLFGVMFGDAAHGSMLLLFSITLCWWKIPGMAGLHPYRYLLLLMGIFSTFCGFLYNDFTSLPVLSIDSCFYRNYQKWDCTFPFGVDHRWYGTSNILTYFNSMKMKISVILGVSQMSLGIFMKALNALHFRRWYDLFYEFIP